MHLTHAQKREIYENGFVLVPAVIPSSMVEAARRAINASLGQGMDPAEMPRLRAQSYCPELQKTPVITDLLNKTPALALAESAIGAGKIAPIKGGQIALRFPCADNNPLPMKCHIDGFHTPTNGVPEGEIQNFTMLVGVFLSDVPAPNSGNFTVWPRSHCLLEKYFREHDPRSLVNGMPALDYGEPQPILSRAGDIALVHYQTAHGVAPNLSPNIRYAVFFRLRHIAHDSRKWDVMQNLWLQWEGMRDFANNRIEE